MIKLRHRIERLESGIQSKEVEHLFVGEGVRGYQVMNYGPEIVTVYRKQREKDFKRRCIEVDRAQREEYNIPTSVTLFLDIDL